MASGSVAAKAAAKAPFAPAADLTPDQFIQKIVDLRPLIRDQQQAAEDNGGYVEAVHEALKAFGGYNALRPRRYGGFEFDIPTFIRVAIEMARSDPGSGWCYTFAAGHIVCLAAHYDERAQDEIFSHGSGLALAPLRAPTPSGVIKKADGGWVVDGTWDFGSGMRYATHVMATARLVEDGEDGPPRFFVAVIPTNQITVLKETWGGDRTLGLRASGSHSFRVEQVFVPEHMVSPFEEYQYAGEDPEGTLGSRLHGNPIYLGLTTSYFAATIAAQMVGAAWAAVDEFTEILKTRRTVNPPFDFRYKTADYQMILGEALMEAKAADAALMELARWYQGALEGWAKGVPLTAHADFEASALATQAARTAVGVVEKCFYAGGSTGAMKGGRLGRYFRDMAMYRTHPIAQYHTAAQGFAQAHLGLPVPMLEAVGGKRAKS